MSEILMTLEDRIIQHLSSFTNPLGFEKLLNSLNINPDYPKTTRKMLRAKLLRMKAEGKVRHSWGPLGWIDIRGRNGRYGNDKGKHVNQKWNSKDKRR